MITAEQAREALQSGRELRMVVGVDPDDPTLRIYLEEGMVVSESIAGWSEGVVEPVCDLDSDFLAEFLDGYGKGRHSVEVVDPC